jgi:tetratricopeptide (TPR) repeat protein
MHRVAVLAAVAVSVGSSALANQCEDAYKLAAEEKHAAAVPALTSCLERSDIPKVDRSRFLQGRAWSYYRLGKLTEAIADQERSFEVAAPSFRLEFINYAVMLRDAKRYDDSLRAIQGAERIDQQRNEPSMMTNYHKGWTLQEAGRHQEAIAAFTHAVPFQPEFPFVYWRRSLSHEAQGNKSGTEDDMRIFARLYTAEWRKHSSPAQQAEYRSRAKAHGVRVAW